MMRTLVHLILPRILLSVCKEKRAHAFSLKLPRFTHQN